MNHAHYWEIGVLAGLPAGQARCKLCFEVRLMPDVWIEDPYAELQKRTFGKGTEKRAAGNLRRPSG